MIGFVVLAALLFKETDVVDEAEAILIKTEEKACGEPSLYQQKDDLKVYLVCLSSLTKNRVDLKNDEYYLDNLIHDMEYVDEFEDYTLYLDFRKISYDGLSVIQCKESNTFYIGSKDLRFQDSMCKDNNPKEGKTFVRTYDVLNIADSNEEEYVYITLHAFQDEEVVTVKILRDLCTDIKAGSAYEFTFVYTNLIVKDNISSIFGGAILVKIEKTDKTGLDRVNDGV